MVKIRNLLIGLMLGAGTGYFVAKHNQSLYTLHENNGSTYLFSKSVKKSYEINPVKNDFYLGGIDHNINGVKDLAYQSGLFSKEKDLMSENQRSDSLENKLDEQETLLERREFLDKLETWSDKLHLGYQHLRFKIREERRKQRE